MIHTPEEFLYKIIGYDAFSKAIESIKNRESLSKSALSDTILGSINQESSKLILSRAPKLWPTTYDKSKNLFEIVREIRFPNEDSGEKKSYLGNSSSMQNQDSYNYSICIPYAFANFGQPKIKSYFNTLKEVYDNQFDPIVTSGSVTKNLKGKSTAISPVLEFSTDNGVYLRVRTYDKEGKLKVVSGLFALDDEVAQKINNEKQVYKAALRGK